MNSKDRKPGRRGFLLGALTGFGAAAALASTASGKTAERSQPPENQPAGPVLYQRTAETERYYKTLYS